MTSKRDSNLLALCVLLLPVALVIAAYYPGHITGDGVEQLMEARSHQYNDWHPPFLTFLWGLIDRVWPGTGAILILHQLALTAGAFMILRRSFSPLTASVITAGVIVAPPVLGVSGMIAKDAALLSFLVLATGLMMTVEAARLSASAKLLLLGTAALLLVLMQLFRYNAVPLTGLAGYALLRVALSSFRRVPARRHPILFNLVLMAAPFAVFTAIMLSVPLLNHHIFDAQRLFPYQHIMIYDLISISIETGHLTLDNEYYPYQDLPHLKEVFSDEAAVTAIDNTRADMVHQSADPAAVRSLVHQWLATIVQYPGSYLTVRSRLFSFLLGLPGHRICTPFFEAIDSNSLGLEIVNINLNRYLVSYLEYFGNSIIDRVWVYVVLNIFGMTVLLRKAGPDGGRTLAIIAGSTLLYAASYYWIAPSCEFRYAAPVVLFGIIVTATVAGRAGRPRGQNCDLQCPSGLAI